MDARDILAWNEGWRTCAGCGAREPGHTPAGWHISRAQGDVATGERALCKNCLAGRVPIRVGQVYASTRSGDVQHKVRQRCRVVGVDWCSHLVWLRTDDAIRVCRPIVVAMSTPLKGAPHHERYIPNHRLVAW